MIGIIGYGMVGKAVEYGFPRTQHIISDPQYNNITVSDVCRADPEAVFVCVPTPTDDNNYSILTGVLDQIRDSGYGGITIVKSTVLPKYLENYDVVYNPEFLSRSTSLSDFVRPPILVIGGERAQQVLELYVKYSCVYAPYLALTDIKTAALAKYTFNTFYATKIAFMNQIYDVAEKMGVNYDDLVNIIDKHPWMGSHHLQVPGDDNMRGFGGPCLPKDTEAFTREFDLELLKTVLKLNDEYRNN